MTTCSCGIDMDIDIGGSCDFFTAKIIKARKNHKCCECKRSIEKSEEYEKTSGMWDGRFDEFKTCSDCISLRNEFFTSGYYYERIWEDFKEHVNAVDSAISESCLSKLTPLSRARACDIIQQYWDEYGDITL